MTAGYEDINCLAWMRSGGHVGAISDGLSRVCSLGLLMSRHPYPGFRGLVGGGIRQVAEWPDGTWLALLG